MQPAATTYAPGAVPSEGRLRARPRPRARGFTLLELCVVIVIIGVIAGISAPYLVNLIAFGEVDGEARRLAGYGSSVVAEAALFKTPLLFRVDLDRQEYYTVQLVYPEPEPADGGEAPPDQTALLREFAKSSGMSSADLSNALAGGAADDPRFRGMLPDDFDAELADQQMNDKFGRFARTLLETRAKNVVHTDGFLDEIGPLFEKEFTLEENEPVEEELGDPILARRKLPEGIQIESVSIDGGKSGRGLVEIEVSPLGLSQRVGFHVVNADGEYMTVWWDPLSGRGVSRSGKQDV